MDARSIPVVGPLQAPLERLRTRLAGPMLAGAEKALKVCSCRANMGGMWICPLAAVTCNLAEVLQRQRNAGSMADSPDSKSGARKGVWVQVPLSVLKSEAAEGSPKRPQGPTQMHACSRLKLSWVRSPSR